MLSFDAAQLAAVALESKIIKWGFTITDKNAVVYQGSIGQVFENEYTTDFSASTGWTLNGGAAISGGVLTFPVDATTQHRAYRHLASAVTAGTFLRLTYTVVSNDAVGISSFQLRGDTINKIVNSSVALDSSVGTHSIVLTAGSVGALDYLMLQANGIITSGSLVIDDLSLDAIIENDVTLSAFSGIELRRNMAENTVIAPSDVSFTLSNPETVLDSTDFKGGKVLIDLYISDGTIDTKMASWLFRIKTAQPGYQKLMVVAEDFLQSYLEGYCPNTRAPEDIFPSNRTYNNKALCVPVPFGTAYIPLRDVFITDDGFIVLGDPAHTYTITKIRSPRSEGSKVEWDSGSYSFTQSTKADADAVAWRVFQAIIADTDNDGNADAHGCWMSPGGPTLDPLVQFSRDDTVSLTNFADLIDFVLQDMGVPSANIDTSVSFAAAHTIFDGWGLTCNGAFWYHEKRETVLAKLLTMCHSCLHVGEKIELHVLSKTSQKSITPAEILRSVDQGEGSFVYQDIVSTDLSDSGYVAYQESGEAQDEFVKALVGIDGAATVISSAVVECPFVQDSQDVKRIGTLHFQRLLGKEAQINFLAKGTCFGLQPDDIITLDDDNYGGTYDVLIDSVKINKDLSLQFVCSKYKVAFDDWGDLSPAALSIPADTTVSSWTPVVSGPDSSGNVNALPDRIRIGTGNDYIVLDPNTPLRVSVYAGGVEKVRFGNLNGFLDYVSALYGLAAGDLTNYIKIDPANGVVISGALTAGAGSSIAGAYIISLGVDKLTAGTITSKAITLALTPGGGDVALKAGKTDFGDTTSGFILGIDDSDSDKPKFEMGDATRYINMSDGVISLSDALIVTDYVADDNITRIWTYTSESNWVIAETNPYATGAFGYSIANTAPFTPSTCEFIILSFFQGYFGTFNDASDIIHIRIVLLQAIDIVLNGVLKWVQSTYDPNSYYCTTINDTDPGFPSGSPACCLKDAQSGGGKYANYDAVPIGSNFLTYWDFGDYDSLGYSTPYVRVESDVDPNTLDDGELRMAWVIQTYNSPYISGYMDSGISGSGKIHISPVFFKTFSDTLKRSFIFSGCYFVDNGALSSPFCYIDQANLVVLERKK